MYNVRNHMKFLDLTLPTPQENLALDEVLMDRCEEGLDTEVLRFWEAPQYFVVLGYSSKIEAEVKLGYCRRAGVAVFRRSSGGGTVLQGPGCLSYSLILKIPERGPLAGIRSATCHIMKANREALSTLEPAIEVRGVSDLAVGERKFSGNAQRRKRRFFLFHGTFLLDFDLARVEDYLELPGRQPDYRAHRSHTDFLMNLRVPAARVKEALKAAWSAGEPLTGIPFERLAARLPQALGS